MKKTAILLTLFVAFSCGSSSPLGNLGGLSDLVKNPWSLSSLAGNTDLGSLFGGSLPFLNFSKDGKVSGSDGCNNLTGSISPDMLSSGKLDLSSLATTKKACPEVKGSQSFLDAISKATNFKINDNVLNLLDGAGKNLASFIPKK